MPLKFIFIGFSKFDEFGPLKSVPNNVVVLNSIISTLSDADIFASAIFPHELIDKSASEVREKVDTIFADTTDEDRIVVYINGHGVISHQKALTR